MDRLNIGERERNWQGGKLSYSDGGEESDGS